MSPGTWGLQLNEIGTMEQQGLGALSWAEHPVMENGGPDPRSAVGPKEVQGEDEKGFLREVISQDNLTTNSSLARSWWVVTAQTYNF